MISKSSTKQSSQPALNSEQLQKWTLKLTDRYQEKLSGGRSYVTGYFAMDLDSVAEEKTNYSNALITKGTFPSLDS